MKKETIFTILGIAVVVGLIIASKNKNPQPIHLPPIQQNPDGTPVVIVEETPHTRG